MNVLEFSFPKKFQGNLKKGAMYFMDEKKGILYEGRFDIFQTINLMTLIGKLVLVEICRPMIFLTFV